MTHSLNQNTIPSFTNIDIIYVRSWIQNNYCYLLYVIHVINLVISLVSIQYVMPSSISELLHTTTVFPATDVLTLFS